MQLLVTGGAGYIGSVVCELAVAAGHGVVVVDDLREGSAAAIPPACRFVQGRVGDRAVLDAAFGAGPVDAVLHLAAEAAVAPSMTDPSPFFHVNVVEGLVLLDAMRAYGCSRLIFSSTAATYGEPQFSPITERHPQVPINAYGASKLMFETCLRWYHRAYGLRVVGFRYFNAAGATASRGEARRQESHLLPLAIDAALGRRAPLRVFGTDYDTRDGTCVRDYVHVADIARAHLQALACVDALGLEFVNLGSEHGFTVLEIVAAVEQVVGTRVPWQPAPRRTGDPGVLVASANRARDALEWTAPASGIEAIVSSAVRFRRDHPFGYADVRPA
jgi:UDP-glucose 4-epimerase